MTTQLETWKLLTMDFSPELNDALQQQHHAAQYIALVGRHLIPQKPDDSNTNMEFVPEKGMLIGNPLSKGMKVGLKLSNLELTVLDEKNNTLETISFDGKTKKQAFAELKSTLSSLRIDTNNFTDQLHYEIPAHSLDNGAHFSVQNEKYFIENLNYRHNARLVLTEITANIDNAEAVKIWPHHFDTGSFISYSKNEKCPATAASCSTISCAGGPASHSPTTRRQQHQYGIHPGNRNARWQFPFQRDENWFTTL